MAIESRSNWAADKGNAFRFTGVSEYSSRAAAKVRKSDLLFMYVPSPASAFSDVRRVLKNGLARSPHTGAYEADRPLYVERVAGFFARHLGLDVSSHLRLVEEEEVS